MTYEEIKEKYPVGKIINISHYEKTVQSYYYNENDLKIYRQKYGEVTIINDTLCSYVVRHSVETIVDGWIFDGEEWMPAYDTWDGWISIPERDLKENDNL